MVPKKEQILQAAIKIFAREGLDRGKIADIATAAGVGKGTVYEYFRSKDELFAALEETLADSMLAAVAKITDSDLSPPEKIRRLLEQSIALTVGLHDEFLIITELFAQSARGLWHGSGTSVLADMYAQYRQAVIAILEEGVASGDFREMNTAGVSTLLLAVIDGLIWQYVVLKDSPAFKQSEEEAIRSFMRGIER